MFSKPILLVALMGASAVSASGQITTETNAYSSSWGCAKCLRNSQTFIVPSASIRGNVSQDTDYKGVCCTSSTDATNCASMLSGGALAATNRAFQYVVGTNSLEVLMGQCEYNTSVCASSGGNADSIGQYRGIDGIGINDKDSAKLTMSGSYKADKDQCTWVVKVECGAPGLKINTDTTVTETQAILSFVDYSNQFINIDKVKLEGDAPADVWLPHDTVPVYYDMSAYNGEPGNLAFEVVTGGVDNYWRTVPGRMIHEWHDWVLSGFKEYSNYRSSYYNTINKLKRESEQENCFWPDVFGSDFLNWCKHEQTLVLPHPNDMSYLIKNNTYPTVATHNVATGYGKTTAGAFTAIASDGGRSYGVNGENTKYTEGTKVLYDNNQLGIRLRKETDTNQGTGGCDDSYMMISMIPLADAAGTLSVTVSSEKWKDDLASPLNDYPTLIEDRGYDLPDTEGAHYLKAFFIGYLASYLTLF